MSIGKLILYPTDAGSSKPDISQLVRSLQKLGLMGKPLDSGLDHYFAGETFLQLISFMGCSTDVCLTPSSEPNTDFCHLTILGPLEKPVLKYSKNARPPLCKKCQTPIADWKDQAIQELLICSICQERMTPNTVNWGRRAGYSSLFIEINNIFPGEARPVSLLFERLQQITDVEWKHFFLEE